MPLFERKKKERTMMPTTKFYFIAFLLLISFLSTIYISLTNNKKIANVQSESESGYDNNNNTVPNNNNNNSKMVVKHIVMFSFKTGTSETILNTIKTGLLNLPKQIGTIRDYELGNDLLLPSGQNHPAGKNRILSWSCTFNTIDEYESYSTNTYHTSLINDWIKPNLEPGSRAAIQYEVPEK